VEKDLLHFAIGDGELQRSERRLALIEDQPRTAIELTLHYFQLDALGSGDHEGSDARGAVQGLLQVRALSDAAARSSAIGDDHRIVGE
jgi:hypothetical protein